tara:strand:+ start:604 stop:939 length:336 start_codon:yes stop_codon:yes gene_type:complete
MQNKDERFVVVTTVSQFRQRYAIPVSKLQKSNLEIDITNDTAKQIEWAEDSVSMEQVKEFSQHWLGESIIDSFVLDEERVLNLFDKDNDYLKTWSVEQKMEYIHKWEEKNV